MSLERTQSRSHARRRGRKARRRAIALIIIVIVLAALGFGVYHLITDVFLADPTSSPSAAPEEGEETVPEESPPAPVEIDIVCVGDIIVHSPQIEAANRGNGNYDFSEYFPYVRPYIESADLAVCNLELTFGGEPYSGYPMFSTPDPLAATLKDVGFDVGITANNHMLDSGPDGIARTIGVASDAGLLVTGSVRDASEKDWLVTEVKGVRIGVVAYTYETPGRTINGISMSDATRAVINSFGLDTLDADMQEVKRSMDGARADGAEILICVFHWGNEYERQPNDAQRRVAESAAEFGADVIFASHPHVLQPFELITSPATGRQTPVFWSMGNFISNQRTETLDTSMAKYTEQGIIARVLLTYDPADRALEGGRASYIPTWVDKYNNGTRNVFTVAPLEAGYESNPDIAASGHADRAGQALAEIHELLGPEEGILF
ncbi:MAG: CapA family protein [Clostridiales Family XIII bacterium]|nr:CapA family protein [Clostridiales Family XIII bacterium]